MKQPELGKKLAELRQEKNMTQEELVDACNVSVRTIQRIESGEVTPRISTVKILLSALGENIERFDQNTSTPIEKRDLQSLETWLQFAWIIGIAYFVLGFVDTGIEVARLEHVDLDISPSFYLTIKIGYLTTYIIFLTGMIKLGDYFQVSLVSISCYLLIGVSALLSGIDILSYFVSLSDFSWITLGTSGVIAIGAVGVVFGVGLIRLQDAMGVTAKAAGILEIIAGCCLITVLLTIVGFIVYIPAMILEIVLLFKGYEYIRAQRINS